MDSRLSEEETKQIAAQMAKMLIEALTNEEVMARITAVWWNQVDIRLGKGLRRFTLYIGLILIATMSIKFDVLSRLMNK